jgi:deoxyribonuclease-4
MRRIGFHTSIAGGIHKSVQRAHDLGCSTMQIFSHNPRGWGRKKLRHGEVISFNRLSRELDINPVFIHASYLINLASPNSVLREKSIRLLSAELRRADDLGVHYVVLHPGRSVGKDLGEAVRRASMAISRAWRMAESKSGILLENTAGQRGDISSTVSSIGEIVDNVPSGAIKGICLDTCHVFAAGYDIRRTEEVQGLQDEIERHLSPIKVRLIHVNDSKKDCGSRVDRHEHIGEGHIGRAGMKEFFSASYFNDIPLILETPKTSDRDDKRNLTRIKRILREIGET